MSTQLQGRAAIGKTGIRAKDRRNKTGVVGVSEIVTKHGRQMRHKFVVSPMRRGFNITTLGRAEAFRRAVRFRAEHEARVKGAR